MTEMRPMDQELLERAALAVAPDLDLQSLRYLGNADDTARASYVTVRSTDDEHADRWDEVRCLRSAETYHWSCSAYPKRALRLKLDGGTMLQVEIPPSAGGRLATRWVREGLPMIQTSALAQPCDPGYGAAAQHEELKQVFAHVQGSSLTAIAEPGGFALIANFQRVFFDFDPATDPAPRLRCWFFPPSLSH